jgi:arylsulfatase
MNNYTEHTWVLVTINDAIKNLMKTLHSIPSTQDAGRGVCWTVTLTQYQHFQFIRDQLAKEGINMALPSGN